MEKVNMEKVDMEKKPYQKPEIVAQGNYIASLASCGKQVSHVNSNCGH